MTKTVNGHRGAYRRLEVSIMLTSLVYVSSATEMLTADDLLHILEHIRPRNRERGLTGTLLYSGGNIIQVLEGAAADVNDVFARIWRDDRHTDVTVIWHEFVERRTFPDWSMGFRELGRRDAADVEGFSDFLRTGSTNDVVQHTDPSLILLRAFRETAR